MLVRLIRGWERRYVPDETGGVRLSKARLYRAIGEEDGLGDRREGEIRLRMPVTVSKVGETIPEPTQAETIDRSREEHGKQEREPAADDDLLIELRSRDAEEWEGIQHLKVDDCELDSPFLFCLAREPTTRDDWERLRAALPERYDAWTVTDDVHRLKFEIECGLKRWMGLNEITEHELITRRGFVTYPYDPAPPSRGFGDVAGEEVLQMARWFRKRRKYRDQEEYRLAWLLRSSQWERTSDCIYIELTRTGIGLFQPWTPPK